MTLRFSMWSLERFIRKMKIENTANDTRSISQLEVPRPGTIEPESIPVLNPGDSVDIRVTLKVPSSTRITKRKNTDVFHIRTKYFVQRFSSTWCLKINNLKPRIISVMQHPYLVQNVNLGEKSFCLNWTVQIKGSVTSQQFTNEK